MALITQFDYPVPRNVHGIQGFTAKAIFQKFIQDPVKPKHCQRTLKLFLPIIDLYYKIHIFKIMWQPCNELKTVIKISFLRGFNIQPFLIWGRNDNFDIVALFLGNINLIRKKKHLIKCDEEKKIINLRQTIKLNFLQQVPSCYIW
jgi:hypothetical protein